MNEGVPVLELRGITKRFPGVIANEDVSLRLHRGEVQALLGENGAGKTTLMNILYGLQQPDEGEVLVRGEPVSFTSRGTPSGAASAWSTSTSCWCRSSPSPRTSSSAPSRSRGCRSTWRPRPASGQRALRAATAWRSTRDALIE